MNRGSWICPQNTHEGHSCSEPPKESTNPTPKKAPPRTNLPNLEAIRPEWAGKPSVVAAPGPSLTPEVAKKVKATGWPVLVCQDAWRLMPWADKLYGCDSKWWVNYNGIGDFDGEKWSTHHKGVSNDKTQVQERFGVRLVGGRRAQYDGFSFDPAVIHYGDNSGFQALNLAVLLGSPYIVLVGYNMSSKNGHHFFGKHTGGLHNQEKFERWVPEFDKAAEKLPPEITIINATPDSALTSFAQMSLDDAIADAPK